jgi:hypothetical protein
LVSKQVLSLLLTSITGSKQSGCSPASKELKTMGTIVRRLLPAMATDVTITRLHGGGHVILQEAVDAGASHPSMLEGAAS